MLPLFLIAALAAFYVYETSKPQKDSGSGGGEPPATKDGLVPEDAVLVRTAGDYYAPGEARVTDGLKRVLGDPLSTVGKSAALPEGLSPGVVSFGAERPLVTGERMTFEVVDGEGSSKGVLEGIFSGPEDPDEGPSVVLVDRVALSKGVDFTTPGKYSIPASSKRTYHDRLRRVVWSPRDPSEKDLKGFSEAFKLDPGDKVTVLLRDDYGTYVVGIAQVRETRADGSLRVLLLSPYATLADEGKGDVAFTRMLNQGLVDMKFSQLVDPKSLKK